MGVKEVDVPDVVHHAAPRPAVAVLSLLQLGEPNLQPNLTLLRLCKKHQS